MWIALICFVFLSTSSGFLLEPDHTANPAVKNQCLPLGKYLSEKEDLLHHIDQLQRDNEQKMDILTSELKSRLSAFEKRQKKMKHWKWRGWKKNIRNWELTIHYCKTKKNFFVINIATRKVR